MNSSFGKINIKDLVKGSVVAAFTAVIFGLNESLQTGSLPDIAKLKSIGVVAISAGLGYVAKQVLQNSDGELLKTEQK